MKRTVNRYARAAVLIAALLLPLSVQAGADPRPAVSAAGQAAPYTYQGTVHSVQLKAGYIDVITGVGHAVRLVHIRALPATRITAAGATILLSGLKPGDVVRAECRKTDAALVADRIDKLSPTGSEPGRTP